MRNIHMPLLKYHIPSLIIFLLSYVYYACIFDLQRVSKKMLWKFNRLSCNINVAKQFNFYTARKNSYLAFQ
jgi:hypothetical protein